MLRAQIRSDLPSAKGRTWQRRRTGRIFYGGTALPTAVNFLERRVRSPAFPCTWGAAQEAESPCAFWLSGHGPWTMMPCDAQPYMYAHHPRSIQPFCAVAYQLSRICKVLGPSGYITHRSNCSTPFSSFHTTHHPPPPHHDRHCTRIGSTRRTARGRYVLSAQGLLVGRRIHVSGTFRPSTATSYAMGGVHRAAATGDIDIGILSCKCRGNNGCRDDPMHNGDHTLVVW